MSILLQPEEMNRYNDRERSRLAAERYALQEAVRNQRSRKRQERSQRLEARSRPLLTRLIKRQA